MSNLLRALSSLSACRRATRIGHRRPLVIFAIMIYSRRNILHFSTNSHESLAQPPSLSCDSCVVGAKLCRSSLRRIHASRALVADHLSSPKVYLSLKLGQSHGYDGTAGYESVKATPSSPPR